MTNNKKKGFTIIEMLVVISIIGLLASIMLTSLARAKIRAYNSKYSQEVLSLHKALIMYKLDNDGVHPPCSNGALHPWPLCMDYYNWGLLDNAFAPLLGKYISKIPKYVGRNAPFTIGTPWAAMTYFPNYYNVYSLGGLGTAEYSCDPINYSEWTIGSLPGIILIISSENLDLPNGTYTRCDTVFGTCETYSPAPPDKYYCLSLKI